MREFIDPTPSNPIDAVRFLSFLDLTAVLSVLGGFYCEQWRHRHPPEAMLRLVALYKLKRFRFLTEIWKLLDDETIRLLGFRWKPSYKTVWHWLNVRLGPEGLEKVHSSLMKAIKEALEVQGVSLGVKVAGDASPVQAMPRDREARYNGYYRKVCYLVHRLICSVTNLTLSWTVTPGNVDESYMMVVLLVKALLLSVIPEEAGFDNGYASPRNYALLGLTTIKPFIGFRKNAKPNWRGKPRTLRLRFKKMVKDGVLTSERLKALGINPNPHENSTDGILSGLMITGQHEYVGAYYRNISLSEFCQDGKRWLKTYVSMRNTVEGSHGHQKDWLDLDNLRVRGLQKAMLHTALSMLSEAAVACTRVQNGVFKGLTSIAYLK
jgi:hypothetical protein